MSFSYLQPNRTIPSVHLIRPSSGTASIASHGIRTKLQADSDSACVVFITTRGLEGGFSGGMWKMRLIGKSVRPTDLGKSFDLLYAF